MKTKCQHEIEWNSIDLFPLLFSNLFILLFLPKLFFSFFFLLLRLFFFFFFFFSFFSSSQNTSLLFSTMHLYNTVFFFSFRYLRQGMQQQQTEIKLFIGCRSRPEQTTKSAIFVTTSLIHFLPVSDRLTAHTPSRQLHSSADTRIHRIPLVLTRTLSTYIVSKHGA